MLALDHVGSTAVPGLAAKPVIDVDLTVADSSDEASYVPDLQRVGFELTIREPGWHEHRLLQGERTSGATCTCSRPTAPRRSGT